MADDDEGVGTVVNAADILGDEGDDDDEDALAPLPGLGDAGDDAGGCNADAPADAGGGGGSEGSGEEDDGGSSEDESEDEAAASGGDEAGGQEPAAGDGDAEADAAADDDVSREQAAASAQEAAEAQGRDSAASEAQPLGSGDAGGGEEQERAAAAAEDRPQLDPEAEPDREPPEADGLTAADEGPQEPSEPQPAVASHRIESPLPRIESPRPGSGRPASTTPPVDADAGAGPLVLPPARGSAPNSRETSRVNSHLGASTSAASAQPQLHPHPQSPTALPPIKPSPQQAGKAGGGQSGAPSPQGGGKAKGGRYGSRYWQPPPPPPPPPKPKPRQRHPTANADPAFLNSAAYRTVPNVGRVYDWQQQHEINQQLSKQRKLQAHQEKVLEAARLQLAVRGANEEAFQQWLAAKAAEKRAVRHQARRVAYVQNVYQTLIKDDPADYKIRESLWVPNFGIEADAGPRLKASPPKARTSQAGSAAGGGPGAGPVS